MGKVHLLSLVEKRARLSAPTLSGLLSAYLPPRLEGQLTLKFLLGLTRHTPRDFTQLLTYIQKHAPAEGRLTREQVLAGARQYSIDYFRREIIDELSGYVHEPDRTNLLSLVGSLRRPEFTFEELRAKADTQSAFKDIDLPRGLHALFECSAIGNKTRVEGGDMYYTYKFRNRSSTISYDEPLLLHRGLWKNFNVTANDDTSTL